MIIKDSIPTSQFIYFTGIIFKTDTHLEYPGKNILLAAMLTSSYLRNFCEDVISNLLLGNFSATSRELTNQQNNVRVHLTKSATILPELLNR